MRRALGALDQFCFVGQSRARNLKSELSGSECLVSLLKIGTGTLPSRAEVPKALQQLFSVSFLMAAAFVWFVGNMPGSLSLEDLSCLVLALRDPA